MAKWKKLAMSLCLLGATGCSSFGASATGARLARMQASPNHVDGVFANPVLTELMMPRRLGSVLREFLFGGQLRRPAAAIPTHGLEAADLAQPPESGLRLSWLGHSSVLIEIDGFRILTDPIWSERASPSSQVGPLRFFPAPLPIEALPRLDAILISHDHYDHLDQHSVERLAVAGTPFIVPLGVGAHLEAWGVPSAQIVELDWGQRWKGPGGLELICTPARHFSGRGLFDRNRTLWASWVIKGPRQRVFFGGDTGMFPGLSRIGLEHGPFEATLLPIGAYFGSWTAVHLDPEQAIAAHRMLRGKLMLPIHWGTFNLALHDWFEPAERLLKAARDQAIELAIPRPGQSIEAGQAKEVERWWPQRSKPAIRDDLGWVL